MAIKRKLPDDRLDDSTSKPGDQFSDGVDDDVSSLGNTDFPLDPDKTTFDLDAFAPYKPLEPVLDATASAPEPFAFTPVVDSTDSDDDPGFASGLQGLHAGPVADPDAVDVHLSTPVSTDTSEQEKFDISFADDFTTPIDTDPPLADESEFVTPDIVNSSVSSMSDRAPRIFVQIGKFSANYEIDQDEMLIGRADSVTAVAPEITIDWDDAISRLHARIFRRDGATYIEDLGSTNGTKVNDVALTPHKAQVLQNSDIIHIGSNTEISYYA